MSNLGDGGPAFPSVSPMAKWQEGMTLRDWFAGQALVAVHAEVAGGWRPSVEEIAHRCYAIAAAMLAMRAKEPKP